MKFLSTILLVCPATLMAEITFGQSIDVIEFVIMLVTAVSAATMAIMAGKTKAELLALEGKINVLSTRVELLSQEIADVKVNLHEWRDFCQATQRSKLEELQRERSGYGKIKDQ